MLIDYVIPAIGQQEMLTRCIETLIAKQAGQLLPTTIWVIDNGSETPLEVQRGVRLLRNDSNTGMVESLYMAKQYSSAEILIYSHSDFFLYESGWDSKIRAAFLDDPKLGLLGAVGARVAEANGGRSEVTCAFRDGELHGRKPTQFLTPCTLLDGCFMAFRREAMDEARVPDLTFPPHHFYDKAWSLDIALKGWKVAVIDLDCEHLSGKTSCQPECQRWFNTIGGEQNVYDAAERRYLEKYGDLLPVWVDFDGRYHTRAGLVYDATAKHFQ